METHFHDLRILCENRRSCREYKQDPIPQDAVKKIISIASLSPYAGGRKNWGIIELSDKGQIKALASAIEEEVMEVASSMENATAEMFKKYALSFNFFSEAPLLLIPYFRVTPVMKILLGDSVKESQLKWERDNSVKSISCVSMLILLAAESLGLGACYMTGPLIAEKRVSEIVQIPPGREAGAIIPIGYPLKTLK